MTLKLLMILLIGTLCAPAIQAQEVPKKISNIELLNLDGEKVMLPYFGEKNLLIFYIDPDRHKQNHDFTVEMEENGRASGENIVGFGVMNLKDAPMIPNGMARSMAKKRTETNGALVLADESRTLSSEWGIGDCNNKFVLLLISKECELVFIRKGTLSETDIAEFYEVVQKYR